VIARRARTVARMPRSRTRPRGPSRPTAAGGLLIVLAVLSGACVPGTSDTGEGPDGAVRSERSAGPSGAGPAAPSSCPSASEVRLGARLLHSIPHTARADPAVGTGDGPSGTLRILTVGPDELAALVGAIAAPHDGSACVDGVLLADGADVIGRTVAAASALERGLPLVLTDARGRWSVPRHLSELTLDALPEGSSDAAGRRRVVLVDVDDTAAQVEVVAGAVDGWFPVLIGPGPEQEQVAALLVPLPGREVRWAASSVAHARALDDVRALFEDAGVEVGRYERALPTGPLREVWLGDVRTPEAALMAAAIAAQRGAAFVAVDGSDLRSGVERTGRIRAAVATLSTGGRVVLVGGTGDATRWQLETVLAGTPLPGGGFLPLEDRRIVAIYGSPDATGLGLLGEQEDVASVARAREFADRYEGASDGRIVVPGLDVIATIASSAPEPTGDFSRRVSIERLRPLVELALADGMAVLLDLQPGRTSFLAQAREYEELLLQPHVHLALDPEWRIGPGERHLVHIGSVEAAEVQEVVDWLAALVRRERLPQKVLMLHQFTSGMLPDRDAIVIPPELVGVIHVDGQGPLATKDRTYAALTAGAAEHWEWGWKNFTRIDTPVASPERTLDRVPVPVVVTYQ